MESQPQNLVIRFFGVHGVKQVHGRTVRFVVMHNMFNTDLQVGRGRRGGRAHGVRVGLQGPSGARGGLRQGARRAAEAAVGCDAVTHSAALLAIPPSLASLRLLCFLYYNPQIHRKFDLKGSTDGRTTGPVKDPSDPKTVFKDLDLDVQVGQGPGLCVEMQLRGRCVR